MCSTIWFGENKNKWKCESLYENTWKDTQNTVNGENRSKKEVEKNYYFSFNTLYVFLYCLVIYQSSVSLSLSIIYLSIIYLYFYHEHASLLQWKQQSKQNKTKQQEILFYLCRMEYVHLHFRFYQDLIIFLMT